MHEEKKKLMGLFVAMAFILTALWMFPTAARAEDGDDILITEIHVYGENTRLNIGKPYEYTTTLSGPYADAMEIEGQRWVNKDDPEDVIAEGNTDTLTVTDVATGGLKSYSNQDTWNYELLDMDVYGFNDWPSE